MGKQINYVKFFIKIRPYSIHYKFLIIYNLIRPKEDRIINKIYLKKNQLQEGKLNISENIQNAYRRLHKNAQENEEDIYAIRILY